MLPLNSLRRNGQIHHDSNFHEKIKRPRLNNGNDAIVNFRSDTIVQNSNVNTKQIFPTIRTNINNGKYFYKQNRNFSCLRYLK